jgi:predicted transcriptional regulator of viral defense system
LQLGNDRLVPELSGSRSEGWTQNRKVRLVAAIAASQWGVISIAQLIDCGLSAAMIKRWVRLGWLHPIHRGVYAFGHPGVPIEGQLTAALFHAGAGAALSHTTAAWWWGLVKHPPELIEVTGPAFAASTNAVKVRHRKEVEAVRHRRLPVTTIPQTLLDFASQAAPLPLQMALAQADYRGLLDVPALKAKFGRGKPGSAQLREALETYEPKYAFTRSRLERAFIALCRRYGIPLPHTNVIVNGWLADAVWFGYRLIVELDGLRNHRSRAQLERDHRRDFEHRAAGFTTLRYTETQVLGNAAGVADDVIRQISLAERLAG